MSVAWESDTPASSGEISTHSSRSERGAEPSMDKVGEYIIRRLVGEGGMGKVYEAEERLSKRRVALKVLREELAKSEKARGLFLNEMQILAHLEHPNIVRSLASVEADGKLCTVLEFLDGETLREVLNERERMSWEEAASIVASVGRALVAAHGQEPPVIHRDLKPENIMILDDGGVKVMDFGIAKLVQELNQTNTQSVGTLQYMSPEQIDAQTIDHRTDLYCLGLVFYELLCGHPPFSSSSPRTLLNMQCTEEPPPLDDDVRLGVPKGIEKVLFQLLEKSPEDRPTSAQDLVDLLEMFLPEQSTRMSRSSKRSAAAKTSVTSSESPSSPRHDTLPSASEDGEGGSDKAKTTAPKTKALAKKKRDGGRKDTIALIDQASEGSELSTGLSMFIIVALMVLAGAATYLWRASAGPEADVPAGAETTTETSAPAKTDDEAGGW
jgi:eukaryotic-like serine/threonine-protein kinase